MTKQQLSTNSAPTSRDLYLDLIKRSLTGMLTEDPPLHAASIKGYQDRVYIPKVRELGRDVPKHAATMIGLRRMDNIQSCLEQVIADGIPGDCIETGVWRGGATIFMRAILAAYQVTDRTVWVADSFQGLPKPNLAQFPADHQWQEFGFKLAISEAEVRRYFDQYQLLDDQVRFLPGWFKDSLPTAPIEQLALLRLDGDLYESTWQVLNALYDKVSPGGFVIVDDYNLDSCRQAVHDYREQHNIQEPIVDIDRMGAYWRKTDDSFT